MMAQGLLSRWRPGQAIGVGAEAVAWPRRSRLLWAFWAAAESGKEAGEEGRRQLGSPRANATRTEISLWRRGRCPASHNLKLMVPDTPANRRPRSRHEGGGGREGVHSPPSVAGAPPLSLALPQARLVHSLLVGSPQASPDPLGVWFGHGVVRTHRRFKRSGVRITGVRAARGIWSRVTPADVNAGLSASPPPLPRPCSCRTTAPRFFAPHARALAHPAPASVTRRAFPLVGSPFPRTPSCLLFRSVGDRLRAPVWRCCGVGCQRRRCGGRPPLCPLRDPVPHGRYIFLP